MSGSLVFTDTIRKTFDDLFASVTADVTVSPKEAFDAGFSGTVSMAALPASTVQTVEGVEGVESADVTDLAALPAAPAPYADGHRVIEG